MNILRSFKLRVTEKPYLECITSSWHYQGCTALHIFSLLSHKESMECLTRIGHRKSKPVFLRGGCCSSFVSSTHQGHRFLLAAVIMLSRRHFTAPRQHSVRVRYNWLIQSLTLSLTHTHRRALIAQKTHTHSHTHT